MLKCIYPLSLLLYDQEDIIGAVSLNGVGIDDVWICIFPYSRILAIVDLFGLTKHNLVRNGILFIYFIILFKWFISVLEPQIFRDLSVKPCLLGIDVSVFVSLE